MRRSFLLFGMSSYRGAPWTIGGIGRLGIADMGEAYVWRPST